VVQLDACCMHGPRRRAGGVGALEGLRTPSLVAQKGMDFTDHHLLVGKDAQVFARNMAFKIDDYLNTERSRPPWLECNRRSDPLRYHAPIRRGAALRRIDLEMMAEGWVEPNHFNATTNCNGLSAKGEICGVPPTSGTAWKIPRRAGGSPTLGAGLDVDNDI